MCLIHQDSICLVGYMVESRRLVIKILQKDISQFWTLFEWKIGWNESFSCIFLVVECIGDLSVVRHSIRDIPKGFLFVFINQSSCKSRTGLPDGRLWFRKPSYKRQWENVVSAIVEAKTNARLSINVSGDVEINDQMFLVLSGCGRFAWRWSWNLFLLGK